MLFPINKLLFVIIICILILISIISYFQGYVITCSRIFMCLVYCSLLITFYFTYSVKIAKKMIKKQIHLSVSDINNIQKTLEIKKTPLPENKANNDDEKTIKKNKTIWNHSKIIIGICLTFSILLSGGLWIYKNQNHKYYNFKLFSKEIIFKNILILLAVLLVQFLFSTIFVANILPLNSKEIIKNIIQNYFNS